MHDDVKDCVNTVSCSLDAVLKKDCFTLSQPKIREIKKIDNDVKQHVNLNHYSDYNTVDTPTTFLESINAIVNWSSDLKMLVSAYGNYMIPRMIDSGEEIPEINDRFFTKIVDSITGKCEDKYFIEFTKIHKIDTYFPWLSNTAQVVCHLKNEMKTVCKNNLTINSNKRILANIRWRLLNYLFVNNLEYDSEKLQKVVDQVFSHLIEGKSIVLKEDQQVSSSACNIIFAKDIDMMKNLLIDDPNSRANLLKKKKAIAQNKTYTVSTELQSFHLMLKLNPHKFLKYMYFIQKEINDLQLSREYMKFSNMTTESMSKNEIIEVWKEWKYGRIKMPSFKLMPLNSIDRQFIRIDKKSLSELSIATFVCFTDCEIPQSSVFKNKIFEYESDIYYKVKQPYIEKNNIVLGLDTFEGLCLYHSISTKKTIVFREIFKSEIDSRTDKWWLDDVVDIYSRRANIRQLRRETFVRNPMNLKLLNELKTCVDDKTYSSWVPGASFLTDGVQFKLPLLSERSDRTRGLDILFDKGFSGFKVKPPSQRINITNMKNGIYHDTNDNIYTTEPSNMIITGIDPGRKRPLSSCTVDSSDLPHDWNDDERIFALDKSMDNNVYVSNDEYREHTGSLEAEEKEKKRRVGDYKKALENMLNTNKRSGLIEINKDYYSKLFESWNAIRKEKFNIKRSYHRFRSYSKSRKSLAYFAKRITNEMKMKSKATGRKPVVMFGNGTFRPGGTGQASVPRKPFIRELAVRFPVIITNEFNTSKLHPFSFEELKDIGGKEKTSTNTERLRMCTTNTGNSGVDLLMSKERDRDTFGSCSIMQKGFYQLIGNPITSLQR